jgi:hypothetical protein
MNEQPVLVANLKRQRSHPREVLRREIGGVIYAVSIQRLFATVRPPLNEVGIGAAPIRGEAKHMVVIPQEAAKSRRGAGLFSHQTGNHFVGGGPSIDIVAQEEEIVLDVARALSAGVEQRPELLQASVDVSNREGHAFVHIDPPLQPI